MNCIRWNLCPISFRRNIQNLNTRRNTKAEPALVHIMKFFFSLPLKDKDNYFLFLLFFFFFTFVHICTIGNAQSLDAAMYPVFYLDLFNEFFPRRTSEFDNKLMKLSVNNCVFILEFFFFFFSRYGVLTYELRRVNTTYINGRIWKNLRSSKWRKKKEMEYECTRPEPVSLRR